MKEVDLAGVTNDEKLSSCLVNLRKNEIVTHGQLSKAIARIRNFVDAVIESKGQHDDGNNSPLLYVCGNPGTGKTMSVTKICRDAVAAKLKTKEEQEKAPKFYHISCVGVYIFISLSTSTTLLCSFDVFHVLNNEYI